MSLFAQWNLDFEPISSYSDQVEACKEEGVECQVGLRSRWGGNTRGGYRLEWPLQSRSSYSRHPLIYGQGPPALTPWTLEEEFVVWLPDSASVYLYTCVGESYFANIKKGWGKHVYNKLKNLTPEYYRKRCTQITIGFIWNFTLWYIYQVLIFNNTFATVLEGTVDEKVHTLCDLIHTSSKEKVACQTHGIWQCLLMIHYSINTWLQNCPSRRLSGPLLLIICLIKMDYTGLQLPGWVHVKGVKGEVSHVGRANTHWILPELLGIRHAPPGSGTAAHLQGAGSLSGEAL